MQEYFDRLKNDFRSIGNKKSVTTLVVVLILVLSIPLGINLLKQTLNYFSRAGGGPPIELLAGKCVVNAGDKTINCNEIPLKLLSPLGGPITIPNPPKNLRVERHECVDNKNMVVLKWDKVDGVSGYYLKRKIADSSDPPFANNISPADDIYSDYPETSGIVSGTKLKYTIIAGVEFQSDPSNEVEVVTKDCGTLTTPTPTPVAQCTTNALSKNPQVVDNKTIQWTYSYPEGTKIKRVVIPAVDGVNFLVGNPSAFVAESGVGRPLDANLGDGFQTVTFQARVQNACSAFTAPFKMYNNCGTEMPDFIGMGSASAYGSVCSSATPSPTPQPTPRITLNSSAVCVSGSPAIQIDFNDTNENYTVETSPNVFTNTQFAGRLTLRPLYLRPPGQNIQLNSTYSLFIQSTSGNRSNTVTVTTPASCPASSINSGKAIAFIQNILGSLSKQISDSFLASAQEDRFKLSGKVCVRIDRTQYQNQGSCQSGDLPFTNRQVLLFEGSKVNIEPRSPLREDQASFKVSSDSSGNYSFPNLVDGAYRASHRIPEGFERLTDDSQPIDITGADKIWDFVLYTNYTIKGTAFIDMNKDGRVDSGDVRQANETIVLADDEKGEHIIATTKTDNQGNYKFERLGPITDNTKGYRVTHEVPPGFTRTTDNSAYPIRVNQDRPVAEVYFGYTPLTNYTSHYRIADSEQELEFAEWRQYKEEPLVTSFNISDESPGAKKLWVEFKSVNGETRKESIPLTWVEPPAEPASLSCTFDIAKENVKVTVGGSKLGNSQGKITADGKNLEVLEWKDDQITALIKNPEIKTDEGRKFKIKVTTKDGATVLDNAPCEIDTSLIYLGARLFCREPGKFDQTNVKINLIDQDSKKIEETVTIDKDGVVRGLKTKLESGKKYVLSIKAPKSVRRNAVFTATGGTTIVKNPKNDTDSLRKDDFILPVGDIAPLVNADGKINTLDRAVLTSQWRIFGTATKELTGDFNRDTKVNSFDWACMRYDFNAEDEEVPSIAPPPAPPKPTGPDLTRNLITYWNMNDATGSAVPDVKGANPGLAVGTTSVPGKISSARSLNGTSDYIQINDSNNLAPNYQSVSAWVLPRSFDKISTDSASVYNRRTTSDPDKEKHLGGINLAVFQGPGGNGVFSCNVYVKDLGWRATPAVGLAKDQWNHLVCAFNGSTVRVYKNGSMAGVYSISGASPVNNPVSPLTQIGRDVSSNMFLDGLVDEVGIWSRGLQPIEVQKLYNGGKGEDPFGNIGN